jgi:hypothetical protein
MGNPSDVINPVKRSHVASFDPSQKNNGVEDSLNPKKSELPSEPTMLRIKETHLVGSPVS